MRQEVWADLSSERMSRTVEQWVSGESRMRARCRSLQGPWEGCAVREVVHVTQVKVWHSEIQSESLRLVADAWILRSERSSSGGRRVCPGYTTRELGNGQEVESRRVWWLGVNSRLGQQEQRAEFLELGHEVKTGWAVWLNWFEADLWNCSLTIPYIFLPERLAHS